MSKGRSGSSNSFIGITNEEESSAAFDLRRGPWTLEEDNLLIHYITCNGEGRWNTLAKCAGLNRTGKSCRLRWLNYLKPDIKRGNLTPQEQLLILELHSKWGNRWSRIAQHLPGRTDNEIKNYWRTRVQKQARQLNVDSNSKKFLEAIRRYWMPRLLEKVEQNSSISSTSSISSISTAENPHSTLPLHPSSSSSSTISVPKQRNTCSGLGMEKSHKGFSSDSLRIMRDEKNQVSPVQFSGNGSANANNVFIKDECYQVDMTCYDAEIFTSPDELSAMESQDIITFSSQCQISAEADWFKDDMPETAFWNMDELWHFRKPEVGI